MRKTAKEIEDVNIIGQQDSARVAVVYNVRVIEVPVQCTQHIRLAGDSGMHNWIIVGIRRHYDGGGSGKDDLGYRSGSQVAQVLRYLLVCKFCYKANTVVRENSLQLLEEERREKQDVLR